MKPYLALFLIAGCAWGQAPEHTHTEHWYPPPCAKGDTGGAAMAGDYYADSKGMFCVHVDPKPAHHRKPKVIGWGSPNPHLYDAPWSTHSGSGSTQPFIVIDGIHDYSFNGELPNAVVKADDMSVKILRPASFHDCSEVNPKDMASAFCNSTQIPEGCRYISHYPPTGESGYECDALTEESIVATDGSKIVKLPDSEYTHLQALRLAVSDEEWRLAQKYGARPAVYHPYIMPTVCVPEGCPKPLPDSPSDTYTFHGQFLLIEKGK